MTTRVKLTKRVVDAFVAEHAGRDAFCWDDEVHGFGVRIRSGGKKTFVFQYRAGGTRSRRLTLGVVGSMTVEQARKLAKAADVAADKGEDPSFERRAARTASTVAALFARYLVEHATPRLKPEGRKDAERIYRDYIQPRIGSLKVADVTRADISDLMHAMSATPIRANRTLALLSKMFNLAERWGLRQDGTNPTRHVDRNRENRCQRFLTIEELGRLGEVLDEVEREGMLWPTLVPFIRLLLFTGARRDEIRTVKWEHVDLEAGLLRLPDSKTGAKVVHIPAPAARVLAEMPRNETNPYVIWGAVEGQPLVNVKDGWAEIRNRAGLNGVRLHDLRHTHASIAVSGGASLPLIGKLLGHTQAATTERYAHLENDPVAALAARVGDRISAAMKPSAERLRAEVVDLRTRRG